MWIQFIDGWPRVVLMAVGLVAVVWLVITGRLYRRRRAVPPWPDPLLDAELRSGAVVDVRSSFAPTPPPVDPRIVRRLRAASTAIRVAGSVLIVLMLVLLAWAAFAFLSSLPGWN